MAKENIVVEDITPENIVVAEKELSYTESDYKALILSSLDMRKKMLRTASPKQISEMYGMYYNALAGLIRSGVLCSRECGADGFPEIQVISGNKVFKARESVLQGILKEEAEEVIKPYEDHFESYVDINSLKNTNTVSSEPVQIDNKPLEKESVKIKKLNSEHKLKIDELNKKYKELIKTKDDEIKSKDEEIKKLSSENKALSEKISSMPFAYDVINNTDESMDNGSNILNSEPDTELAMALEEEKKKSAKLIEENKELKKKVSHQDSIFKKKAAIYEDEIDKKDKELAETKKYVYDPNYDHYYADELPKILDGLEFKHQYFTAKILAIVLCCGGMAASLLLLI